MSTEINRNVLVTGGAGYVGSHACKMLSKAGFTPITLDNLSRGHACAVKWGPLERGDVRDVTLVREVLQRWQPSLVLHFAGVAYVGESMIAPELYYDTNVGGTLSLLQAMVAEKIGKLVFSSTCAIYSSISDGLIHEALHPDPMNPYGASKLAVERMIRDFGQAHGLSSVILRYFNAAGADPEGEIGENHDPEPHLLPRILMAAAGSLDYFDVFGDDYPTDDGTCVRDFVHVSDLAHAHILAAQRLIGSDALQLTCNLGTGRGMSVRQMITAAEKITGHAIPTRIFPRRPGDPARLVADYRIALKEIGFSPRLSSDEEIIRSAWSWLQNGRPKIISQHNAQ